MKYEFDIKAKGGKCVKDCPQLHTEITSYGYKLWVCSAFGDCGLVKDGVPDRHLLCFPKGHTTIITDDAVASRCSIDCPSLGKDWRSCTRFSDDFMTMYDGILGRKLPSRAIQCVTLTQLQEENAHHS